SIALNGACMTVTSLDANAGHFTIDLSAESLARTAGLDRPGAVNLEKALRPQDRLGGHLVSGHVDGVGHVVTMEPVGESWELRIHLIPHTVQNTALHALQAGTRVNLEIDLIARYVERMLSAGKVNA